MDEEKVLVQHLGDLRKVIVYSIIFFLFCFIICLFFIQQLIPLITREQKLAMLGPLDVIRFYTGIAGSLSLGFSAPFIGFQLWSFIKPALTPNESKNAIKYIPAMLLSFVCGILFGFFAVFSYAYQFLITLGTTNFDMVITAQGYFSFLLMTTIPMGFLFEVPFILMFLTAIGVVTPEKLSNTRKYAYVILAIVSAMITPPDFISQLIVLIPLFLLFEIGIWLSRGVHRKQLRRSIQEAAAD
jgi:sec-independent protein translocase protein TatC